MAVIVRQACIEDYPAISNFIREACGPLAVYKGEDRWRWQFIENPAAMRRGNEVPVWIALDGTRVVGQIAIQRTWLNAGMRQYEGGWIVDVIIFPSYRGLGLGHLLYSAVVESGLVLVTLTMAMATRRMAERLGAITLPVMHQYSRLARPTSSDVGRYLVARSKHRHAWLRAARVVCAAGLPFPVAWSARCMTAGRDHLVPTAIEKSFLFHSVDRFDERVSDVWTSQHGSVGMVPRTAGYLNWRFVECPLLRYERFLVEQHGRTVGYLVLRRSEPVELRQGFIVDGMAANDDAAIWRNLFCFAIRRFGDHVCSVEAAASTPVPSTVLASLGFLKTRRLAPVIVCKDRQLLAELSHVPIWFFDKGDHDWDQIQLA
jgi:GNAT superfamily N-acetyltransferase